MASGDITNKSDIAAEYDFKMFDASFNGITDECGDVGLTFGNEGILESDEFQQRFDLCEKMTEEEKNDWKTDKKEELEGKMDRDGPTCDRLVDSTEVMESGETLYAACVELKATCEVARDNGEKLEECKRPEMDCAEGEECERHACPEGEECGPPEGGRGLSRRRLQEEIFGT